jgi:hypothetical protein
MQMRSGSGHGHSSQIQRRAFSSFVFSLRSALHHAEAGVQKAMNGISFPLPLLITLLLALAPVGARAQTSAPWPDDLVNHMTGQWELEGKILGRDAHHEVRAEWVLNHQFLNIQEKTAAGAPSSEHRYEASWFLGYDPVSERYVLHLLDVFGGRFSETLGYGTRDGNSIRFVFEYADGPFHTTYRWSPQSDTWQWLMEQKDKADKWTTFANLKLTRSPQ